MKDQQLIKLVSERPAVSDSSSSALQQSRMEIAKLVQENAQLAFIQQQTERLLSVQGTQLRERVRLEIERLDAELQAKEQALQNLRAETEERQTSLNHKIHALQIQLAEKTLLVESRDNELSHLKATIHRLSQQLAQQGSGTK